MISKIIDMAKNHKRETETSSGQLDLYPHYPPTPRASTEGVDNTPTQSVGTSLQQQQQQQQQQLQLQDESNPTIGPQKTPSSVEHMPQFQQLTAEDHPSSPPYTPNDNTRTKRVSSGRDGLNEASTHVPNLSSEITPEPAQVADRRRDSTTHFKLVDFKLLRTLGTGSFGRVHLCQSKFNGEYYAMKVMKKADIVMLKQVAHTINERKILLSVSNTFIVNLWGTFQDDSNLYMVMDYVPGGELFSVLRKAKRFIDDVAKFYAGEVLLAIIYLHNQDIIYRDLKPENILLDASGHVKLTDFGFAKKVPDVTWTLCGTPDYLAPEVIQSKGYGKAVDFWSFGVLVFEMLAGYPPFYDENQFRLYEKILTPEPAYPSFFEPEARNLLEHLLTDDLSKRYGNLKRGYLDVVEHPWFANLDFTKLAKKEIKAPFIPQLKSKGDASNFDEYPEETKPYGRASEDPYRKYFLEF